MLWNASTINGYDIVASDGCLGTVNDLLFEDAGWTIRWLVVDTGNWLSGRKVLLPVSALGKPDPSLRQFPVKLTMRQVKDSPDVGTDQPVSRQIEENVYSYYGWDPYWGNSSVPLSNAMARPLVAPLNMSEANPVDPDSTNVQLNDGYPHLRSISVVTGYNMNATDGEIGHAENFLVHDDSWSIHYITVDTRNWWPGEKVLISPYSIQEIDWEASALNQTEDSHGTSFVRSYLHGTDGRYSP